MNDAIYLEGMSREEQKFWRFHNNNPQVYEMFIEYAMEAHASGKRVSHWLLVNRIRWEAEIVTNSEEVYRIPNGTIGYYARLFINDYPEAGDMFETRPMAIEPVHPDLKVAA